jgi:hypothetical protein
MATLKTLEEFGCKHAVMRPRTYTVSFGIRGAGRIIDAINAIGGSSAGDYLMGDARGGAVGWQPADQSEHGISESDAWGEVILEVRAVDEHNADRAARKILTRALARAETPVS